MMGPAKLEHEWVKGMFLKNVQKHGLRSKIEWNEVLTVTSEYVFKDEHLVLSIWMLFSTSIQNKIKSHLLSSVEGIFDELCPRDRLYM